MNNTKSTIFVVILLGISCLAGIATQEKNVGASGEQSLMINSPKKTYQLGEMISVEAKITNNASMPIYLEGDSYNPVTIKIAFSENKDYKLYAPQGKSITLDGINIPTKINPQETLSTQSTILWNYKPSVSHLNSKAAKPFLEGRLLSDFAFPEAGTYFIKGFIYIQDNGKVKTIESEPIKITIAEPVGEDLEVWSKIKENGDFAYFIQEGELTRGYHKPEEVEKFLNEIEQIINQYPNSFYAESLRQSLGKFQAAEVKRQEFMQKLKQKQPQ